MATMLEECTTEDQRSVVRFFSCGQKDIYKDMCPIYVGKRLSSKAVQNWVEKLSQADDVRPSTEVAETTVKNFYAGVPTDWKSDGTSASVFGGGYGEK
jgi:hypothetical protein